MMYASYKQILAFDTLQRRYEKACEKYYDSDMEDRSEVDRTLQEAQLFAVFCMGTVVKNKFNR